MPSNDHGVAGSQAKRDEGAGRNQHGFSLRDFLRSKEEGRRTAAPLSIVC